VRLKTARMTVFHEIEPAYVLGSFSLRPTDTGYVLAASQAPALGAWNKQGMPFFAEGVTYTQPYQVSRKTGRYTVQLPVWYGSVAEVTVNGQSAGHVVSQPWEVDITDQIDSGLNTVAVTVIGTLKNTLGPHHGKPALGKAWPWDFRQAPENGPPAGQDYHTVDYGLFAPFILQQTRTERKPGDTGVQVTADIKGESK